jgi:hypothetical protein
MEGVYSGQKPILGSGAHGFVRACDSQASLQRSMCTPGLRLCEKDKNAVLSESQWFIAAQRCFSGLIRGTCLRVEQVCSSVGVGKLASLVAIDRAAG